MWRDGGRRNVPSTWWGWSGLAAWARDTVRLRPRRGAPSSTESSVGGPLLWPAGEAWPVCTHMHRNFGNGLSSSSRVPMVPVVQAFRSDLPPGVVPFPDGVDVLQVLWCPFTHEFPASPRPVVFWRDSVAVQAVLSAPPTDPAAARWHVPAPCIVHPERVTEYPSWDLPEDLADEWQDDFRRLREAIPPQAAIPLLSYCDFAEAPGIKLGGYPSWFTGEGWVDCEGCGRLRGVQPPHGPPAHRGEPGVRRSLVAHLADLGGPGRGRRPGSPCGPHRA